MEECDCCLKAAVQFYGQIDVSKNNNNINNDSNDNNNKINIGNGNGNGNGNANDNVNGKNHILMGYTDIEITPSTMDDAIATTTATNTTTSSTAAKNNGINYTPNLEISSHPVSDVEIAEITKIAENAYRYLQIAFAEDLYLYCQANDIVFAELREALNTKWNVNVLEASNGIGGHCLPKDTKMFMESTKSIQKSKLLAAAIEVDRDYRMYRKK